MRFPAREVKIGEIGIGGNNPIRLQSMTNTDTADVKATIEQCIRIFDAGADYARISIPTLKNIQHLKEIKSGLLQNGYKKPIIADIHFNPEIALEAARIVEKIRINPGNYIDKNQKGNAILTDTDYSIELEKMEQKLYPLIEVCKEYGTAIRVGTNFGSLSSRIIAKFGNTPLAMAEATMEFLRIFEKHNYKNTIISLKASNPLIMIQSYGLIIKKLLEENILCPIHLGVTEAGDGENGRIKSALGISTLLKEGIGDTIRVSLSEPPENEIPVAKLIAEPFQKKFSIIGKNEKYIIPDFNIRQNTFNIPFGQKAIVISGFSNEYFSNKTKETLHPDYIYIDDEKEIKDGNKRFIVNSEIIKQKENTNVFPLINIENLKEVDFHKEINFINVEDISLLNKLNLTKEINSPVIILNLSKKENYSNIYSDLSYNRDFPIVLRLRYDESVIDEFIIKLTTDISRLLIERRVQGLWIENDKIEHQKVTEIVYGLLQASGIRISKTEFISCPTCSRTTYDLQKLLAKVQLEFADYPGIKIAVMGCMVNGPGEMADSDFGFIGAREGNVTLYAGKDILLRNISLDKAIDELKKRLNNLKS
ncbi:MAG: (E)-4-hydroxy-3-methylbut-2-enyl-diphosphate synthase [Bacteroidetes bacterium]|nr:(E)-4-hydroxy-3-methylbut-2-enyl-diphosphate synthase [Bacteroidota bacterium]